MDKQTESDIVAGVCLIGLPSTVHATNFAASGVDALCSAAYGASHAAGWHTNIETGEPLIRNEGEMFMLMVTEVTEADEGRMGGLPDDKLPHYPMEAVELADVCIRIGDWAGMKGYPLGRIVASILSVGDMELTKQSKDLLPIVNMISKAMEGHRKGKMDKTWPVYSQDAVCIAKALILCAGVAYQKEYNLGKIIVEKMAFNASREDHKIENRKKDGGKKC